MSNPYQAPESSGIPASQFGFAAHVPVVAVMLIVQGSLEILMGLMLLGMSIFMMVMSSQPLPNADQQPPPGFFLILTVVYIVLGLGVCGVGGLKIWAGWKNWSYRSRGWGIAAICSGFASVFTCYCAPTAIALAIYGLIVYLDNRSKQAFALGEQGYTREQIRITLS
jgi:hypothetical protein